MAKKKTNKKKLKKSAKKFEKKMQFYDRATRGDNFQDERD